MTITITLELNEQNLDKLKALLTEATMEVKTESKPTKKVKVQKQEPVVAEPVEQQTEEYPKDWLPQDTEYTDKVVMPQQPNIQPRPQAFQQQTIIQPKKQVITITKEDIRAAAVALSKAGKSHKIVEIFAKFGGKKLTDFDNQQAIYPAIMEELKNATTC